jgi:predicted nucleic-acid-binding Zn-ribbon protein
MFPSNLFMKFHPENYVDPSITHKRKLIKRLIEIEENNHLKKYCQNILNK